ncbi:MAG: c-type cytochrome [Verrucomicrobia bacterium]|nr:c-type cytochrome [Verrucomicrobiota bacterium]
MKPHFLCLPGLLFVSVAAAFGQPGEFQAAPTTGKPPKESPLTAEEQQPTFTLPPGFVIELVAADPDINKVVAFNFDEAGRLWANTATEYPLDGNENPERAAELYKRGGKDRVLIFDTPTRPGRQPPRTFADGLAMPMGILPFKDGAIVGQGPDIFFLRDTDGDGKADKKELLLTGFGIQDSHLMPHGFVRGPGNWIYLAQGAFNSSSVKTKEGTTVQFDQCKMARFKPDGSRFEIVESGLNNIWGFVINRRGEMFIQEANDLGYPVVPFFIGGTYPGIGMHKMKPHSPWQPPLANFEMGGTGLSGLALAEDENGFPPPYREVMYVANPITGKIQAIKIHPDGTGYRLEKLPDFINCADPWFRPIAIQFGPDGCLYILDWYNKIISHNEVPRTHPERDKFRSRIWRVRHATMPPRAIPDLTRIPEKELPPHLATASTWEARAAVRQIIDRQSFSLASALKKMSERREAGNAPPARLSALWALEGLGKVQLATLQKLVKDVSRDVRREAVRVLGTQKFSADKMVARLEPLLDDPDPQVRAEIIRTLDGIANPNLKVLELLVRVGKPQIDGPIIKPQQGGEPTFAAGPAADRAFERSLVRVALEKNPQALAAFLDSEAGKKLPLENRLLATLSLGERAGAVQLARTVPEIKRILTDEELVLLARFSDEPGVGEVLDDVLKLPATQAQTLRTLLNARGRLENSNLATHLVAAARSLVQRDASESNQQLMIQLASAFRLRELEPEVVAYTTRAGQMPERQLAGLKALREMGSTQVELFQRLALTGKAGEPLQREAIVALASARSDRAVPLLVELWPVLPVSLRKAAVDRLTSSEANSRALLRAVKSGDIAAQELDEYSLDKLRTILGNDPDLAALRQQLSDQLRPVLRLSGHNEDYVDTKVQLSGPFTVETWVKLDPGIDNEDGILGVPGGADFNFAGRWFRIFAGPQYGDVIIANKKIEAEVWTHVAVTRDDTGQFRIYFNGEPDTAKGESLNIAFTNLDIGRTTPAKGTAGTFAEYRIWNVARAAEEIRDAWQISFQDEPPPSGLVHYFAGDSWGRLNGQVKVEQTMDFPPLLSASDARAQKAKFDIYRHYVEGGGDEARGKATFTTVCMTCHNVHGEGANIGPTLNGAGVMGTEALLRSILTPNAAVESGYYRFRVETKGNDLLEGFLVSQNEAEIVLRQPGSEDVHIQRDRVKRASFTKTSMMPEGLLETLKAQDVADLFAYLKTLR